MPDGNQRRDRILKRQAGVFITIEGPNGAGKSSILDGLETRLRSSGLDVYTTTEPSTSAIGQLSRIIEPDCRGIAYACLIAADRYYHIDNEITPALEQGKAVICARYVESSLVLQVLDGVPIEFVWGLNSRVRIPDLSVILTAPDVVLEQRLSQRDELSYFEQKTGRSEEASAYRNAAEFLSRRGFSILLLDNGTRSVVDNIEYLECAIRCKIEENAYEA